ncbi:MAG: class II D-tagatose-bisphosphate aldolase, non-catalytic subunit [Ancalomicrobiaceae bacterium]|nr:class II D-tagatose-bisphosphate aldolase, non-catalytic subunit [Ancalomicrobiaceae bacterium]
MRELRDLIARNRQDEAVALPSVCSAHPDVLTATLLAAEAADLPVLLEATSNQVNQHGGYTGLTPQGFVEFVHGLCDANGVARRRVLFGGDHLGPQAWRDRPAEAAMAEAETLVATYVRAGFSKIHLDCSEGCSGEPAQLSDAVVASRAARLAKVCEAAGEGRAPISYMFGTEVPPPGGARAGEEATTVLPTDPQAAKATIVAHRDAFAAQGLSAAFERAVGLVVQPGLEFAPDHVMAFDPLSPDHLSPILADHPNMAFEAHSTDYQAADVFPALARRHFAVLKVGPALTFAARQALYALDGIADWLGRSGPSLADTMEAVMVAEPRQWAKHYDGPAERLHLLRHFGYADRIRYYWPEPAAQAAVRRLFAIVEGADLPEPLLLQFFAPAVLARAEALVAPGRSLPKALVLAQVQEAYAPYMACQAA